MSTTTAEVEDAEIVGSVPVAQEVLEEEYAEAMRTKATDAITAAAIFQELANRGHAPSYTQLGNMYMSGEYGGEPDLYQAFKAYEAAAELHDPQGLKHLANCYVRGLGVESNVYKSLPYLKEAAELGEGDSQACLGIFYYSGVAGKRDLQQAGDLFVQALNNDTCTVKEDASRNLLCVCDQFIDGGDLARKDEPACYRLLHGLLPHAGKDVLMHAQYLLARCYGTGAGCDRDWVKAQEYLEAAAENGSEEAKDMINKFMEAAAED